MKNFKKFHYITQKNYIIINLIKYLWIVGIILHCPANLIFKPFKRSILFVDNLLWPQFTNSNIWSTRLTVHLQTYIFVLYKCKKLRNWFTTVNFLKQLWLSFLAVSVDFCTIQLISPAFLYFNEKNHIFLLYLNSKLFQYKFRLILFTVSLFYVILWVKGIYIIAFY